MKPKNQKIPPLHLITGLILIGFLILFTARSIEAKKSKNDSPKVQISIESTCSITYSPADPTTDDTITFMGTADPPGEIISWVWDFGDGYTATGNPVTHQYTTAGSYAVNLTTTDNQSQTSTCSTPVSVSQANLPPQLDISFEPLNPTTETFLTFKSGASDPDGEVVNWQWNFGDGSDVLQDDPMYHRFSQAGTYNVSLTVTDDKGATTSSGVTVLINHVQPPLRLPRGWNLMDFYYESIDPRPEFVFSGHDISGNLHRYDHEKMKYVTYYDFAPSEFGPIKPGDGYWFSCLNPEGCEIQYEALFTTDDLEINLPTTGWYLIGASSVNNDFKNLKITNNTTGETKTFEEVANLWLQDPFIGYDNAGARYFTAGLLGTDNEHTLRPNNGFWIYAFIDNLTLKIPNKRPYPKIKIPSEGQSVAGNSNVIATDLYNLLPTEINDVRLQFYQDGAWQPINNSWGTGKPKDIDILDWTNDWDTSSLSTGTYPLRVYVNSVYGEYTDEIAVYIHKEPVPLMSISISEDRTAVVFDGTSSYDPEDGPQVSHEWNFTDDPNTYYTSIVSHPVPTPGTPGTTYEFGLEHKAIDSLGGFQSEHWIIGANYGGDGLLFTVSQEVKTKCGCKRMDVNNQGDSLANMPWIPAGAKEQLGAYDFLGSPSIVFHNFQVEAELMPKSKPDECREGQRVQRTWIYSGASGPISSYKKGPQRKDDWSQGGEVEAGFENDENIWVDDGNDKPNPGAKGGQTKFHVNESWIFWVSHAGGAFLTASLPIAILEKFEARVWGSEGACKCTWKIVISYPGGPNELRNKVCVP